MAFAGTRGILRFRIRHRRLILWAMKHRAKSYRLYAPQLGSLYAHPTTPGMPLPPLVLEQAEAHHAATVLRLRVGQEVEVFDGCGHRARGAIASAGRHEMMIEVQALAAPQSPPSPAVHLAFAVPKGDRLDFLLEKATELAVASLQSVVFERSVAGGDELGEHKHQRWMNQCIAAAKQSGLDFLPQIHQPLGLADLLAQSRPAGTLCLLGDGSAEARPVGNALAESKAGDVLLLVGPEGGLTPQESTAAREAGFLPVRLGQTTLRVETAAIALLAAVRAICR